MFPYRIALFSDRSRSVNDGNSRSKAVAPWSEKADEGNPSCRMPGNPPPPAALLAFHSEVARIESSMVKMKPSSCWWSSLTVNDDSWPVVPKERCGHTKLECAQLSAYTAEETCYRLKRDKERERERERERKNC